MPTTVLVVDDSPAFRRYVRRLLEADGFEVIGEAADGAGALAVTSALRPQVILLDVMLPDMTGFDVCKALDADEDPHLVVLTSSRDVSTYRRRLATSTARGFVPKSELSGATLSALLG